VQYFLRGFNKTLGESYAIQESPERVERNKPAIEAVAVNRTGKRLAIEHTLLQPFEGQKADDQPFLAVFGNLNNDPTLIVPGRLIELHVPVGVIPKGKDRSNGPDVPLALLWRTSHQSAFSAERLGTAQAKR
jgi:hypothetical protein